MIIEVAIYEGIPAAANRRRNFAFCSGKCAESFPPGSRPDGKLSVFASWPASWRYV